MDPRLSAITALSLNAALDKPSQLSAVVGLDAFVDEIIRVVDRRTSVNEFSTVKTMSEFGTKVISAAGQSTNMELVVQIVKLGGNGPIMANALAAMGLPITSVGPFGEGAVHPAFSELAHRSTIHSLGDPGHTDALEFEDGKIMLGKLEVLKNVTWQRLEERVGAEKLHDLLTTSSLVALVNWTMIPAMSDIWSSALELYAKHAPTGRFFFDLADPEKHDDASVAAACRVVAKFQQYGSTTLGLNEKEAFRVAIALGYSGGETGRDNVRAAAQYISTELGVESVVVHPRAYAVVASRGEITADVDGPFTEHPKISTGAGDHFNAGFCAGKLLGFSDEQAATTAVATSGFYVRNAESPSLKQLAEFLAEQSK